MVVALYDRIFEKEEDPYAELGKIRHMAPPEPSNIARRVISKRQQPALNDSDAKRMLLKKIKILGPAIKRHFTAADSAKSPEERASETRNALNLINRATS